MKKLSDQERIIILKLVLAASVVNNAYLLFYFSKLHKNFQRLAQGNRELWQVTDILRKHANVDDPALQEELAIYKSFLQIADHNDL